MTEIKKIDVKSGVGIFRYFEHLELKSWYLIAEYIDNAISSYQQNKNTLNKLHKGYQLRVRIYRDPDNKTISVKDNAAGILDKDLNRAFRIGERPEDTTGLNEFGVGMKLTSFHFTKKWSVRTKALGEYQEKTIILDVDDLESRDDTTIEVIRQPASKNDHYTEIMLEEFYPKNWPQHKTVGKIESFLSSIFRKWIESGDLELIFQTGEYEKNITPTFPSILNMKFVKDSESKEKEWKRKIDFSHTINTSKYPLTKRIEGWVGLLAIGETSVKNAGFDLIRRNRVIRGDINSWFPSNDDSDDFVIFRSGNSEEKTRIFGELNFTSFAIDNNKTEIDWGGEEEGTKEAFLKYLYDLIREDLSKDRDATNQADRERDFWYQMLNYLKEAKKERNSLKNKVTKNKSTVQSKLQHDLSKYKNTDLESEYETEEVTFSEINNLLDEIIFEVPQPDDENWLFTIRAYEGEGLGQWFDYKTIEKEESEWPKEVTVSWDINHNYSQNTFRSNERDNESTYAELAPEIFKIICYLIIAEEKQKTRGENHVALSYWRDALNRSLSN